MTVNRTTGLTSTVIVSFPYGTPEDTVNAVLNPHLLPEGRYRTGAEFTPELVSDINRSLPYGSGDTVQPSTSYMFSVGSPRKALEVIADLRSDTRVLCAEVAATRGLHR
ncbi:MAG: hypothetical protein GF368_00520 [Candidatus Aenigmarchaeota archaeon]|nr:hypothetical protein [Candidatus Aenigmarchaeota archaeon]